MNLLNKKTNNLKRGTRSTKGSYLIEAPIILFVMLIFIAFPMIDLASIAMRSTFLIASAREAARAAARAKTFSAGDPESPSAKAIATSTANTAITKFNGVAISSVKTYIVVTDLAASATNKQEGPLGDAADSTKNVYSIEVEVLGQIEPIIKYSGGALGAIPGLTAPMPLTVRSRDVCENLQGLTS
jgi:Flp pilus assembly protein TadG